MVVALIIIITNNEIFLSGTFLSALRVLNHLIFTTFLTLQIVKVRYAKITSLLAHGSTVR